MCSNAESIEGWSSGKHKSSCLAILCDVSVSSVSAYVSMQGSGKNNRIEHVTASRIFSQPLTVYGLGVLGARRDVLALGAFFLVGFVNCVNLQHL